MHISDKVREELEFDKVLAYVLKHCKGQEGKNLVNSEALSHNLDSLDISLKRVKDVVDMIQEQELFDLYTYESITEDLFYLSKNGYVLEVSSIHRILNVLKNYNLFFKYFDKKKQRQKAYAHLYEVGYISEYNVQPISKILNVFDEEGNVKPNASPELIKIHKRITGVSKATDRQFDQLLAKYKNAQVLSDTKESLRNGRRVLVLPVENKRKIEGVIHDQSATGKTVYIEPQELLSLNNELASLENDLRAEIYRVLKQLSDDLREDRYLIEECGQKLAVLDCIRAKGIFSNLIEGVFPELLSKPTLNLREVKHPLLLLQEKEGGPKTIAFDLELRSDNRILLISGPNAGGKSVTLKAAGLIHLMLYSGLLVPISKESKMSVFQSVFTDIGDHQSIDEGLSTYSSHLKNLSDILDNANEHSLILLDEIGSGTDPKLGGAIAEGIIKGLIVKKSYGIITTHYSELKVFAFRQNGIINGAMLFDKEHLRPTYRLKVGKPGSSYAFEVANKVGLDQRAIKYARKKVGKKENQIEDLLVDLQEGKAILDEQLAYIENEKKQLDALIKNYNQLSKDFQVKRKKLQIRAKEIELKRANDESVQLQGLISKLEKEKNLEKVRKKKEEVLAKRTNESSDIVALKKEILEKKRSDEVIEVGDYVRMIDGDMSGEVLQVKGNKVKVLFGLMQMEVDASEVTISRAHLKINKSKYLNVKGVAFNSNFSPKLDIRGYKMGDADSTLEEFFDKAILNNARTLEVVHGKGKGALRKLVISKIKEYKDLQSYYHPDDDSGGDGVTMIRL